MSIGIRKIFLFTLLMLACQPVMASYGRVDPRSVNLQRFTLDQDISIEKGKEIVSWSNAPALARMYQTKSQNEFERAKGDTIRIWIIRVQLYLLPLLVFFLLIQTRSFFYASPRMGLYLLLWLLFFFFLPALAPPRYDPIVFFATMAALVIFFTRHLLCVHSLKIPLGIIVLAVFCWVAPWGKWLIPESYAYLEEYDFPAYVVSTASKNTIIVHEKLDFRNRDDKAVLFRDERRTFVPKRDLEQMLERQRSEVESWMSARQNAAPE